MPEGTENLRRRFRSVQAAAAAGIVYAICSSVALTILLASPAVSAPQAEVREYYGRAQAGDQVMLAINLMIFSVIGFLWFMAVIRHHIGINEPKLFGTVFFGGGLLYAGLLLVGSAALAAPAVLVGVGEQVVDPGTAAMARSVGVVILAGFATRVQALFLSATSTLGLRTGTLPRWLVVVSYLIGLVLFVDITFTQPSIYLFPAWVALVSIVLIFRPPRRALNG